MIPYRTRSYTVASTPEVVTAELMTHVSEREPLSFKRVSTPFRGVVEGRTFKFSREINYRNSFLPVVVGSVKRAGAGSEVSIVLRLHYFVIGFLGMWFSSLLFGLSLMLFGVQTRSPAQIAIPCGMLLFAVLLTTVPFKIEADKAERLLSEIFATL